MCAGQSNQQKAASTAHIKDLSEISEECKKEVLDLALKEPFHMTIEEITEISSLHQIAKRYEEGPSIEDILEAYSDLFIISYKKMDNHLMPFKDAFRIIEKIEGLISSSIFPEFQRYGKEEDTKRKKEKTGNHDNNGQAHKQNNPLLIGVDDHSGFWAMNKSDTALNYNLLKSIITGEMHDSWHSNCYDLSQVQKTKAILTEYLSLKEYDDYHRSIEEKIRDIDSYISRYSSANANKETNPIEQAKDYFLLIHNLSIEPRPGYTNRDSIFSLLFRRLGIYP